MAIGFAGFAAGSLETETELMKEPLALPDAKRYGGFCSVWVDVHSWVSLFSFS